MKTNFQLIRMLKNHFLSKDDNNTISGHIFVDEDGVYDLGSSSVKFRAVYADSIVGTPSSTDELVKVDASDGTSGFLEDKLAADSPLALTETGTTDKILTLSIDDTAYLHADGSVQLTGPLSVAGAVTIDGVDLSAFKDLYDIHIVTPNAHHDPVTAGDGINVSGQVVSINLWGTGASDSGLVVDNTGLRMSTDFAGDGLSMDADPRVMHVNVGDGLEIASDNVKIHLWGDVDDVSGLAIGSGIGLRIATAFAGDGLSMDNSPRVLHVNVKEGVEIDNNSLRVDEDYAFDWLAWHRFYIGMRSDHIVLDNQEVGNITPDGDHGTIFFDRNVSNANFGDDPSRLSDSSHGGLMLYNSDTDGIGAGWGLVLDTRNMEAVHAEFRSVTTRAIYAPASLLIDPTNSIYAPNDQVWRSDTFKDLWAGIDGWRIWQRNDSKIQMTIGSIKADELHVRVFSADEMQVQRGSEVMSRTFGEVARDFIWPADETTVGVWFKDSPAISGPIFLHGGEGVNLAWNEREWLMARTIDQNTGLIVSQLWATANQLVDATYDVEDDERYVGVFDNSGITYYYGDIVRRWMGGPISYFECLRPHTSSADTDPYTGSLWASYWAEVDDRDWQKWILQRKSGGTDSQVVKAGTVFVGMGSILEPSTFIERSVLRSDAGPYMQMGDFSGSPDVISNWNITTRYGNLNGYAGYGSDTMGMFIGTGFTNADIETWKGLLFSETDGVALYSTDLSMYESGWLRGRMFDSGGWYFGNVGNNDVDSDTASIRFWDGSGDFRIGKSTGPRIYFDVSTPSLQMYYTKLEMYQDVSGTDYLRGVIWPNGTFWFGKPNNDANSVNTYNAGLVFDAGTGDLRIGSQEKGGYIEWDQSTGRMEFKEYNSGNPIVRAYVGTDGKIYAGNGAVEIDDIGISVFDGGILKARLNVNGSLRIGHHATEDIDSTTASLWINATSGALRIGKQRANATGDNLYGYAYWNPNNFRLEFRNPSGTPQAYIDSSTGELMAGSGTVALRSTGMTVWAQSSGATWDLELENSINFKNSTGSLTYFNLGALEHLDNNLYGMFVDVPHKTGGGAGVIFRLGYDANRKDQYRFSGGEMSIVHGVEGGSNEFVYGFGYNAQDNNREFIYAWPNYDATAHFGRASIGYIGYSDTASFSHRDHFTTTNYALRQNSNGITLLNAPSSQYVTVRSDNTEMLRVDGSAITLKPGGSTTATFTSSLLTVNTSVNMSDNHLYGLYSTKYEVHNTAPTTGSGEGAFWVNSLGGNRPYYRLPSSGDNLEVFGWGFKKSISCNNSTWTNAIYVGSAYYIGTLYIDGSNNTSVEGPGVAHITCYLQGGTHIQDQENVATNNDWSARYSSGYIQIRQTSGAGITARVLWIGTPNTSA